jgi:hypothetical protein
MRSCSSIHFMTRARGLVAALLGVATWTACGGKLEPGAGGDTPDAGGDLVGTASSSGDAAQDLGSPSSTGPGGASTGAAGPNGCMLANTSSYGGDACSAGWSWACPNGQEYSVNCSCPEATCACSQNSVATGKVYAFAGCPSCTMPLPRTLADTLGAGYWSQCGF